ncbi:GNAT family N-acetyltransferase [Lactiplantibacillus carotarum]|uniref:GNAT family N-acetyltransferase n=1 Tax=Lactiplantibacillus carotarum TaxID=2993456 RepID=UPI00298ED60F|nr:GNAT family N-acetyltransferase [Lactiplantibacillus carotarum]
MQLTTSRLIIRDFTMADMPALFEILADPTANRFLPWWPLESLTATTEFYQHYLEANQFLAICLATDNRPVGYVDVAEDDSHDMGYGLKPTFWNQGLVTEAGQAMVTYWQTAGLPYLTATHDVQNGASGRVMQKLGFAYQYSYREYLPVKDETVVFRLYQRNFTTPTDFTYRHYWELHPDHWIEPGLNAASAN